MVIVSSFSYGDFVKVFCPLNVSFSWHSIWSQVSEKFGCQVQIWSVTLELPTYWPYPSLAPKSDLLVHICSIQNCIDIYGTENFHSRPPADGLVIVQVKMVEQGWRVWYYMTLDVMLWVLRNSNSSTYTVLKYFQGKLFYDTKGTCNVLSWFDMSY